MDYSLLLTVEHNPAYVERYLLEYKRQEKAMVGKARQGLEILKPVQ